MEGQILTDVGHKVLQAHGSDGQVCPASGGRVGQQVGDPAEPDPGRDPACTCRGQLGSLLLFAVCVALPILELVMHQAERLGDGDHGGQGDSPEGDPALLT